jgi:hypothetical protein
MFPAKAKICERLEWYVPLHNEHGTLQYTYNILKNSKQNERTITLSIIACNLLKTPSALLHCQATALLADQCREIHPSVCKPKGGDIFKEGSHQLRKITILPGDAK